MSALRYFFKVTLNGPVFGDRLARILRPDRLPVVVRSPRRAKSERRDVGHLEANPRGVLPNHNLGIAGEMIRRHRQVERRGHVFEHSTG